MLKIFGFVGMFFSLLLFGQNSIEHQQLVWYGYNLNLETKNQISIKQEIENRSFLSPWRQNILLSTTQVEKNLGSNWKAAAGFTYFLQTIHPPNSHSVNRTELRPQFSFSYKQILHENWQLNHRYQGELRWIENNLNDIALTALRLRYRIQLQHQLSEKLKLKLFEEIHINTFKNSSLAIFDQNRAGIAFQYSLMPSLDLELGYLNWYQQRNIMGEFYDRNILRFTIYHQIDLGSKAE
ncbi:MAG: DUF2490 domain-containing protein [Flavobacteriaceae bacterium]|nr:DUF2490 domain-containing protein [Flavobacteriaceae bacterium]